MTRKSKEPRLGFVDYCRVDTNGKVHCKVDLAIRNEFMQLFAEMTDGLAPPKLVFEKIIKQTTTVTPKQVKQIRATHGDGTEFSEA